jgi:transcriptional regulator of aromatic amino acid metabolism
LSIFLLLHLLLSTLTYRPRGTLRPKKGFLISKIKRILSHESDPDVLLHDLIILIENPDALVLLFRLGGNIKQGNCLSQYLTFSSIAGAIHQRSRRSDKPLVRVNCTSIPKELFESEFFGHAKGAFTGAIRDRAGRFEAANGGTLFLDEVGEIPLELQAKLLRVLQEKSYERVGEDRTRHANGGSDESRFTTRSSRRTFSPRFLLSVKRLSIDRRTVTGSEGRHSSFGDPYIDLSVKEFGCARPVLTQVGLEILQKYDWPGNIRELCNVIERAVILAQGGPIAFEVAVDGASVDLFASKQASNEQEGTKILTEAEIRRRECENILVVLQKTGWKIKGGDGAARLLGVKPTTLISRIKRMGLVRPV